MTKQHTEPNNYFLNKQWRERVSKAKEELRQATGMNQISTSQALDHLFRKKAGAP